MTADELGESSRVRDLPCGLGDKRAECYFFLPRQRNIIPKDERGREETFPLLPLLYLRLGVLLRQEQGYRV
jgi:hypothetical protein